MTRLSTPLKGLDYTSQLSVAGIKAQGAVFVCRYLSNDPWKNLTPSEAHELVAAKIGLVTVWEDGGSDALAGAAVGKSHAEQHVAMAHACGKGTGGFFFFAVDFDTAGSPARTDAYFDGVASVIPKAMCGPYGGLEVVKHQLDRGFGAAWQTYAWSHGAVDQRAQLYQHLNGSSVDFYRSKDGQHWQKFASFTKISQLGFTSGPDEWGIYSDPESATANEATMNLLSLVEVP